MPLCPLPTGTSRKKRCKPCSARSLPHATRTPPVSRISLQMAKEFQTALDAGEFSLGDLKPWKRANLAAILKDPEGWVDEHPSFATDGALGRAKYYASVGGPGVVAAFLIESLRG